MIKFNLVRECIEISYKDRFNIVEGCTVNAEGEHYPELLEPFGTKEEALDALQKYHTDIRELSGNAGTYFYVEEYYVQETEYDKDGEEINSGDIWEISKIKIDVIDKPSYKTVGTFNNYKDAEKFLDDYRGKEDKNGDISEGYISFFESAYKQPAKNNAAPEELYEPRSI